MPYTLYITIFSTNERTIFDPFFLLPVHLDTRTKASCDARHFSAISLHKKSRVLFCAARGSA